MICKTCGKEFEDDNTDVYKRQEIHQQYEKISKRSLSIFRLRFLIIFLFFFTRIFFAKLQLRKNQTG